MACIVRIFFVLFLISGIAYGQVRKTPPAKAPVKKPLPVQQVKRPVAWTQLGLGAGRSRSALFLSRNTKQDNDAHGWTVNAVYGINKILRLSASYTWYEPIQIKPTWYDVSANTFELNLNFRSMMVNANACFYPIVGVSYNVFKGHFTGMYDHLNLRSLYQPNTDVRTRWMGVNAGVGLEQYIKKVGIFGEFRMRVGISEGYNQLTIMDVCLSAGVRYHFRVPTVNRIFGGTRSRYVLDTQEQE